MTICHRDTTKVGYGKERTDYCTNDKKSKNKCIIRQRTRIIHLIWLEELVSEEHQQPTV